MIIIIIIIIISLFRLYTRLFVSIFVSFFSLSHISISNQKLDYKTTVRIVRRVERRITSIFSHRRIPIFSIQKKQKRKQQRHLEAWECFRLVNTRWQISLMVMSRLRFAYLSSWPIRVWKLLRSFSKIKFLSSLDFESNVSNLILKKYIFRALVPNDQQLRFKRIKA